MHSRLLETDVKLQKQELSKMPYLKQETGTVQHRHDVVSESPSPLFRSCSPMLAKQDREGVGDIAKPQRLPLHVSSPSSQQLERQEDVQKEEKEGGPIKMELSSYSCEASYPLPPPLTQAQPKPEVIRAPEGYLSWTAADSETQESALVSQEQTSTSACAEKRPDAAISLLAPSQRDRLSESSVSSPAILNSMVPSPEDPMAGMFALLTASEMAKAQPCAPAPTLTTQMEKSSVLPDCSNTGALEMVALEGMALLSQVAQQEMEPLSQDEGEVAKMIIASIVSNLQI